jgi:hypothetical protein
LGDVRASDAAARHHAGNRNTAMYPNLRTPDLRRASGGDDADLGSAPTARDDAVANDKPRCA